MASAEPKEDLAQDVQSQLNTLDKVAVDLVPETDAFPEPKNRGTPVYDEN